MTIRIPIHVATLRVSFSQASREIHLSFVLSLSLHTLSQPLQLKTPHKYREKKWLNKITIKFDTELKPTQNNCK